MEAHQTVRYFFDDLGSAASGLALVLQDARNTKHYYEFGGKTAEEILVSGLLLQGSITEVTRILDGVPGALRHDE